VLNALAARLLIVVVVRFFFSGRLHVPYMCLQTRALTGVIGAFSDMNTNTYAGHAFRLRTSKGALLLEYVATPTGRMSFDTVRRTCFVDSLGIPCTATPRL
jgi:hypothetical protein